MNKAVVAALAAVAGGLIGASVALLYAPDTGERQRRKIKVIFNRQTKLTKEEFDKIVASLKKNLSKEEFEKVIEKLKKSLRKGEEAEEVAEVVEEDYEAE